MKNFKLAKPETPKEQILYDNHHVVFFSSLIQLYDSNSIVYSLNRELDAMGIIGASFFPINRSVVEPTSVPDEADYRWQLDL